MTTREAYLEKLKAQLDEWDKDIEGLDRETSKADAKTKINYEGRSKSFVKTRGSEGRDGGF